MSACVSRGLLRKIRQKSNNEIISDLKELNDLGLVIIFE